MTHHLAGMYAALLTGFADDGAFSPARQTAITEYVLKQNLTGLYVGGSSGESGLLSTDELLEQQAVVSILSKGKSKLIAHVGVPAERDAVALAKNAAKLGYEALSALPPHAYPFNDAEIIAYYTALAAATDLPLIVYEVPIRTGRPLGLETLSAILQLKNVAGIKFTSTDLFKFSQLKRMHADKVFYFGFDEIYLTGAVLGADGGIGTTYNILGNLYTALNQAVIAGDLATAQELQEISQIFVDVLVDTGVMPGMKLALNILGIDAGACRHPLQLRCADAEDKLRAVLARNDVKKWLV